jgi:hypothetical protein
LVSLDVSIAAMAKTDDKNEVVLTIDLSPVGLPIYRTADWLAAFANLSHAMSPSWIDFDSQTDKLRVGFLYGETLQGQAVSVDLNFSQASPKFNISTISLAFPQSTFNNQAIYAYSDNIYSIASIVKYLSYFVAGVSLLFFIAGYFGGKLQSLEGIAVIQLAALLLVTLKDMGPTYVGLSNLGYSLGITPVS